MKEFNLSQELQLTGNPLVSERTINKIKEFIKQDTELINQFACGNITLLELKQERDKLIGDRLI